ncbi:MAG: YbjN domain-containing protein [Treponema sp.]|nr:YbjN domain-containing protein [Treponema sp.]
MVKMGKIIAVIMILGGVFLFPLAAETEWSQERIDLQGIYIPHLREMGYLPDTDNDGDIQFKVSGVNYFIIIDDKDLEFFQVYTAFRLPDITWESAINAANEANRTSKVAKISLRPELNEEGEIAGVIVSITAELLLNDPWDFAPVFSRVLSLIRNAETNFINNIYQR